MMFGFLTKQIENFRHPKTGGKFFFAAKAPDKRQMEKDIGDASAVNVVMSPIGWMQRAIIQAPLALLSNDEPVEQHPVLELLRRPNAWYAHEHLMQAIIFSLLTDGNAYVAVASSELDQPVELWWLPHTLVEVKFPSDGSEFISSYEFQSGGLTQVFDPQDVIHFRMGIDSQNPRIGQSPLKGLLREMWTDEESAVWVSSLMRNGGIPGAIIAPKGENSIDPEEASRIYQEKFGRFNRGNAMFTSGDVSVSTLGFSPQQMDLSAIRNVSEERVCAALGIPAAVVGFGTGVNQTSVGATLKELREEAWQGGIIPLLNIIAGELNRSLIPLLARRQNLRLEFDLSNIRALQEDEQRRAERINTEVQGGYRTVNEARQEVGLEPIGTAGDIFLRPISALEVSLSGRREVEERGLKSGHSLAEERLAETRPSVTPTERQRRVAEMLDRERATIEENFATELTGLFEDLGQRAEAELLAIESRKDAAQDRLDAERIAEALELGAAQQRMREIFERHYRNTGDRTFEILSTALGSEAGLSVITDIPDDFARAIVQQGGTRAGLVDLDRQTRSRLFQSLQTGRAAGEAGETLARRIRGDISAGPHGSVEARARVIARTETRFAQNASTIIRSRRDGIQHAMIMDNLTGFGDDICPLLDGRVVTLEEAMTLVTDEHPNGTRTLSPLSQGAMEELGVAI